MWTCFIQIFHFVSHIKGCKEIGHYRDKLLLFQTRYSGKDDGHQNKREFSNKIYKTNKLPKQSSFANKKSGSPKQQKSPHLIQEHEKKGTISNWGGKLCRFPFQS